jgi:hypothetical protein
MASKNPLESIVRDASRGSAWTAVRARCKVSSAGDPSHTRGATIVSSQDPGELKHKS